MKSFLEYLKEDGWGPRFQKGEHVHTHRAGKIHYGVVEHSDGTEAHVRWENGSVSHHRQYDGGDKNQPHSAIRDPKDGKLNHNLRFPPVFNYPEKISNEEHKRQEEEQSH